MEDFKAGDIVQLKSGGPKMTIQFVGTNTEEKNVWCIWYNEETHKFIENQKFETIVLKKIDF